MALAVLAVEEMVNILGVLRLRLAQQTQAVAVVVLLPLVEVR